MKELILDIERFPLVVETWGTRDQNIGLTQIIEPDRTCAVGMKWRGARGSFFFSEFHQRNWKRLAYEMFCEADVAVGYNSKGFDVPHLRTMWDLAGFPPPPPVKQIDLYLVAKQFRHPSNKLAYISEVLGLGSKLETGGHGLWRACRAGDPKAWAKFRTYCLRDVKLTEALLDRWQGLVQNPANASLWHGGAALRCVSCGSTSLQRRGQAVAQTQVYARYVCTKCGKWGRGSEIIKRASGLRNLV